LASARGAALILAFYPGDDTPGCTKQLCSYQDDLGQLTGLGARLWGISPQNIESHERFAKKRGLTFPLLADPDRLAIKAYGVNGPLGHTRRSVFVLDAEGVVRWSHVGMLGITFQSSEKLAAALKAI
jgi:peroxiredoxin Q/BCP